MVDGMLRALKASFSGCFLGVETGEPSGASREKTKKDGGGITRSLGHVSVACCCAGIGVGEYD